MSKREINRLIGTLKESGLTLIPLSLYFKDGKAKVEIALARGKKAHDKRATLMEKQANREIDRELSHRSTGKSSRGKSKRYED
jgi:SsrA-binding protein